MFPQLIAPRMRGLNGLFRGAYGFVQICPPTTNASLSNTPVLFVAGKRGIVKPTSGTSPLAYIASSSSPFYSAHDPVVGIEYLAGVNGSIGVFLGSLSNHPLEIRTNNLSRVGVSNSGLVTIAAPSSAGAALSLPAGTTTVYPLLINSGTNLTTPVAGGVEFDGTALYFTPAASSRAVNIIEYVEVMSGTKTLVSQTAAQALLNGTTNGAVTLPIGTYEFECCFSLTALSATSGAFGFALGGTATFTQAWWALADKATLTTPTAPQMTFDTAANTLIATGTVATVGYATITGIIRVTVAGTVIPQVSQTTAAAAVVGANSFARFRVLGSATVQSVGNWS